LRFINDIPKAILERGKDYYKRGRVTAYQETMRPPASWLVFAEVRGTSLYRVTLRVDEVNSTNKRRLRLEGSCDCPYDWGDTCKHQVAVAERFLAERGREPRARSSGASDGFRVFEALVREISDPEPLRLQYWVRGLLSPELKEFRVKLASPRLTSEELTELTAGVRRTSYHFGSSSSSSWGFQSRQAPSPWDRLHPLDATNLDYLHRLYPGNGQAGIMARKDQRGLRFIQALIENGETFLEETGERAGTGPVVRPRVEVAGTEESVRFRALDQDFVLYQGDGVAWTVLDSTVHRVDVDLLQRLPRQMQIPEDRRGAFLFETLPALARGLDLRIDPALTDHELVAQVIRIDIQFHYGNDAVLCSAFADINGAIYRNQAILKLDTDSRRYRRDADNPRRWLYWDLVELEPLVNFLEDSGFRVNPSGFSLREIEGIYAFLEEGLTGLPDHWTVSTTPAFDELQAGSVELKPLVEFLDDGEGRVEDFGFEGEGQGKPVGAGPEIDHGDHIDWFEFQVSYDLGGETYSPEQLELLLKQAGYKKGDGYIRLGNRFLRLEASEAEAEISQLMDLADETGDGRYRTRHHNILYYRKVLKDSGITVKANRVYDDLDRDITGENLVGPVDPPEQVEGVLRGYQHRGYHWLRFLERYHFGGILADDMGLGKTVQTLTLLKSLELQGPALVVCPRTLIHNWAQEIQKFFSGTRYLVYHGTPDERVGLRDQFQEQEIVITSYSIVARDFDELKGLTFSYCVLDEAQKIKNPAAKRTKAVKGLKARRRLVLTGTPLENSLEELWSIMDFLMPGYFGSNQSFQRHYLHPIMKEGDQGRLMELKARVAPFILRRHKQEVLTELPDKIEHIYPVEMTRLQRDTYRLVLEQVRGSVMDSVERQGFNRSRINILAALMRLRQICNHPALVLDGANPGAGSGKLEALVEIVEEALGGGHKVLVFSQFVRMLKIISSELDRLGIGYEYIDGSTRNRMERVDRFNDAGGQGVFLLSLKAAGVGLNLTAADIVIHVDPWWNPMVERQASDRAHRIGQENQVMVYKLITTGTVEEKILKLQERKQGLFDSVVEKNANPLTGITWEDIKGLLEWDGPRRESP